MIALPPGQLRKQRALVWAAPRTRESVLGIEPVAEAACWPLSLLWLLPANGGSRLDGHIDIRQTQLSSYRATSGDGCGGELGGAGRRPVGFQEQRLNSCFQLQPERPDTALSRPFPALAVVNCAGPKLHDSMFSALGLFRLGSKLAIQLRTPELHLLMWSCHPARNQSGQCIGQVSGCPGSCLSRALARP